MNRRIIITVASDGSTEVRTEGFSGSECQQASELIERALGNRHSERLTAEFFGVGQLEQSRQLKQGESE